ncbi:LamG-like jellyroll fold domain-containing protein [Mesorhizobium sp. M2A.F.Ca.ET.067.02.1.1]|uniref:LamG-like jellyroll fold domain-containing protein n=1 Tax=Mesorhizobium sp. M2A.F.Ca.ET.067.02.1.1 TaxID=2496749 RepID=UPI000FD38E9C|nr:LamG-like jellyroll fold domain-containing protein [Mesorhizobium sp. M2A.F.Ca.ET.067.02.1.1]RUW79628.1 hypothetical protein EOA28_07475 [Mesorhizobium sp. M2A.F.Ca.ET.067.02.1.1]
MFPHLIGRRGPGAYVPIATGGGTGTGIGDGGSVEPPVVTTNAAGDVTVKGKIKPGSFGKIVVPLATVQAGYRYTFRYTPHFSQLAQQGKLAMVGFGFKNNNDFHIVGLRGDGSTGLHKYKVYGTPPNGWNKDTGHTTSDGGAAASGTQAGPNYIRLTVSVDGTTYMLESGTDGSAWNTEYSGASLSPFTNVSGVVNFGLALWFNNADAGPYSISVDQFAAVSTTIATFTIASGAVSSDLTDFPVKVNLADMPANFWNEVKSDGGDIRLYAADGTTQLPFDLTLFFQPGKVGELFTKMNVAAASNTVFKIKWGNASLNLLPATDTYGRNAVWSDYDAVIINGLTNRNGSGHDATITGSGRFDYINYSCTAVGSDVSAHEGVAYDGTYFYVIDTTTIEKYDASWNLLLTNSSPISGAGLSGSGANHLGDGCIVGGELFIPIETYPSGPYSNQWVCVFDPGDLSFKRKYDISANAHEAAGIAWDPTNSRFVIVDFTSSGDTKIHKYDASFSYLGFITTASIPSKQGIEFWNGNYYISTGNFYRVSLDGSTTETWATITGSGVNGFMEGLASKGDGAFYVLFDGTPSAIYTLSPDYSQYGWLILTSGCLKITGLSKRTVWTMGASEYQATVQGNDSLVSYSDNSSDSGNRATLLVRGATSNFGAWNSADSWLDSSGSALVNGSRHRAAHTFNGTTNRKIYRDGALTGTDTGTDQRPAGTGDTFYVGGSDSAAQEPFIGSLNYPYLRNGELPAAWLAAEYASWASTGFYAVS